MQGKNLAINWEKCHFMVTEGIVLGHEIYVAGLEVSPAKISLIPPTTMKGIESFLGHEYFTEGSPRISQKLQDHCVDCLRKIQSLNLMKHASLHLRISKLN